MSQGTDILRYADAAMYQAQPIAREEGARVKARVSLLSASPDPLGNLAAGFRMYRGDPVYDLSEITDDQRRWAWEESIKTHLKAPWEFIDFLFMIEGVSRAFTHQIVRQRTAAYAQESLRFAVKEGMASEAVMPIMVADDENAVAIWERAMAQMEDAYNGLVGMGIPAEDARGLLPHAVSTRLIYKTNLRGLLEHAGNRLCTQAQFEWRAVELGYIKAIRDCDRYVYRTVSNLGTHSTHSVVRSDWQFKLLATPRAETFAPVCYHAGKCVFQSELDRGCSIRKRVDYFSANGVPPSAWGVSGINEDGDDSNPHSIDPAEWMSDANAGRTWAESDRPQI